MTSPPASALLAAIRDALAEAPSERARARWSIWEPAPWHAWLLVALARQVSRQRWLMRLWRGPLGAQPRGAEGDVPGMPGWRFDFHGRGLLLVAPDGENLDVDDHGDEGLTVDPYFFAWRLQSLPDPAWPERRVRTLLPGPDVVAAALRELAAAGLVVPGEHGHAFRVVPELEAVAEDLAAIDFSAPARAASWAEHLGDLFLLDDDRAPTQLQAYRAYLLAGLAREPGVFLDPLAFALPPVGFAGVCETVVDGPVAYPAGHALELLDARDDLPFCAAVPRLLRRADPREHNPFAVVQAARYLLRRGVERDLAVGVLRSFAQREDGAYLGELALLLLEHAPAHARVHVRRALRSTSPAVQQHAAAALTLLDQPWCHRELCLALEEGATFEHTAGLRAALLRSSSPAGREAVERWTRAHVMAVDLGPGFTWEEVLERDTDGFLDIEMDALRPWAASVRGKIDPDFDRVVWA